MDDFTQGIGIALPALRGRQGDRTMYVVLPTMTEVNNFIPPDMEPAVERAQRALDPKHAKAIAEYIVDKQNIGNDSEYEQTMTKYIFVISFLYAYSGLFVLAYHMRSFSLCNMLMILLHILQRIGLNLYEYAQPYKKMP